VHGEAFLGTPATGRGRHAPGGNRARSRTSRTRRAPAWMAVPRGASRPHGWPSRGVCHPPPTPLKAGTRRAV
jgi:hypothetical protein